ncbi:MULTISPECIES: sensor histidine kinase [Parabacteroides]|jgi:nitrogen-specific signal transduction histidine kinase|uniref:histidine kinase n=2 Tax=Parabacteroides goldsteinii TaxID=328812 RepID=S0GUB5_9BACT|nr:MULTISPECIES: ATP-binding protein [Parabacteroides]EOS19680.1 PAS domain S-box protein [Parabacteroides goldsteinii dnLKV18]KAI4360682.1 Sensor histidine kinase RcsC [Parabacteroides sp. ASF519]MBF0764894.1 PAS domain S-box protein [Parabacteroides goldsteinii]MDZ3929251.1 ATP-binding protein [Parabacteroides goldsteinii]NBI97182.1 PAS domain S-box protein [Parabacteroides goldsteinii]
MSSVYANYSREDLIREIEILKAQGTSVNDEKIYQSRFLNNAVALRKTFSEVLSLLITPSQKDIIDQSLLTILRFFNVDRVYIGNFDNDKPTFDFTHEVTSQGTISMREDLLVGLPKADYAWWIKTIREGKDIIIRDTNNMPEEAAAEQNILKVQEILSLLVIPIYYRGYANGFIGLDCVKKHRDWDALDVENLRMLTDIISIAIERELAHGMIEHSMKQVLKSEAKFQIIFDRLPWGVELYDENGYLLDINKADLEIFGVTREQAIGLNAFENPNIPEWASEKLKKGEDVAFLLDYNFNKAAEKGYYTSKLADEVKHLRVKGVVLKDRQDVILGFFYIVFDDTESYHKTEEIQYSLAKLKAAVDTGESIIWEYDVATDKLSADFSLNDQIEESSFLTYLKEDRFSSVRDFIETLHPDDRHRVYNKQFKRLVDGEIGKYISVYRRVFDGKVYWLNSNVRAYKYSVDGKPSKIVSYTSNITEQREKELELMKVKEADKLKSAFLANMSHEIRTPLNAIVGFSDLVAETDDPEERQTYLDIIHTNNDLLLNLIGDILDFSKIEAGMLKYNIEEANIKELCMEVYLSGSLKIKPGVKLLFDKNSPTVTLRTDPQRILQVIANFVNNAIKFTSEGSITIFYETKENEVKVCVRDTGIGISEENRPRVFERFIKINDFHQGTGLGLTISKTIIEYLGGTIGVDSVQGKGSTFWFTLPLDYKGISS